MKFKKRGHRFSQNEPLSFNYNKKTSAIYEYKQSFIISQININAYFPLNKVMFIVNVFYTKFNIIMRVFYLLIYLFYTMSVSYRFC